MYFYFSILFKLVHLSSKLELITNNDNEEVSKVLDEDENYTSNNPEGSRITKDTSRGIIDKKQYFRWSLQSSDLIITANLKLVDKRFLFPLEVFIHGFGKTLLTFLYIRFFFKNIFIWIPSVNT